MSDYNPSISILLPTRGRTDQLDASLSSLIDLADNPSSLEFLLAFDNDDKKSSQYFLEHISSKLDNADSKYYVYEFERLGYQKLNEYINALAKYARSPWWVFWNDDAIMLDHSWDSEISKQEDRFCIQAFDTHRRHPYSIFPIVPRAWYDFLGHLSQHPLSDAYISQIAWLLDIMVRIPIKVEHQRFDLTGKNKDQTFLDRKMSALEGNISNPTDFNHPNNRSIRLTDANVLAKHLGSLGYDMTHWNESAQGKREPWKKMLAADVNNQMMELRVKKEMT